MRSCRCASSISSGAASTRATASSCPRPRPRRREYVGPRAGGRGPRAASAQRAAVATARSSSTAWSRPSGSANSAEPATNTLAPDATAPDTVEVEMPPSTSMSTSTWRSPMQAAELRDLRLHRGEVALAAEAGVHGHDEDHVDEVEHVGDLVERGGRVEGDGGLGAELGDRAEHPVEVDARLGVHDEPLATGLDVQMGEAIGLLDHEVGLERDAQQRSHRGDDVGTEGEVGHEPPVHHVELHAIDAGLLEGHAGVAEMGEVDRQDRRGDLDRAGRVHRSTLPRPRTIGAVAITPAAPDRGTDPADLDRRGARARARHRAARSRRRGTGATDRPAGRVRRAARCRENTYVPAWSSGIGGSNGRSSSRS